MLKAQCPNCGSPITFRAGETVYAVCSYCSTGIVRNDVTLESIGKVAVLNDTWSALQLGTEGDFDGGHFFVIGRTVLKWDRGTWSEWYLSFNDGRSGWMSEAQGFYAVSFPKDLPEETPTDFTPGSSLTVDGVTYKVTDTKRQTIAWSEGELPFQATPGRAATTIDLTGPGERFASIEKSYEGYLLFVGKFANFDDLNLTNLKAIDGW